MLLSRMDNNYFSNKTNHEKPTNNKEGTHLSALDERTIINRITGTEAIRCIPAFFNDKPAPK